MVYGIIQLINFAHGEVVMIGAMVAFTVINALAPGGLPPLAVVLVGTACAIPVCMLVGYSMERLAYRPLRSAPRLAPLITAIGVSILLQHLAMLVWSRNVLAFPQIIDNTSYTLGGASITNVQIAIIAVCVALMGGLALLVYRTQLGTAMRATAQNPQVAGLMGVDVNRVIAATFVIGAALGAVAGVLYGTYYGVAQYTMGSILGLKAFSAAVLGGIGNIPGAMLGGVLLGLVEALCAGTAWVRIANFAILYILLALGLNIVVGFAGLLDLGYIAFYAVGAYTYALLASPHFNLHLPFWVILPIGAALAALFGLLLGAPTLKLRGDYLAIVTLGFGEIVRIFLNNLSRPVNLTNGPQGVAGIDPFRIDGFDFAQYQMLLGLQFSGPIKYYYLLLAVVIAVIVINLRLQNSRIGRAWEAIREDEIAASAMGINTRNVKLLAFAMGASFGGLAGGMFSAMQAFISPESFVLVESIMVVSMVVLGGMGNIWGVILGALLLSFVPEILRWTVEPLQDALFGRQLIAPEVIRMLIFGLALVLVMLFRPAGLLPSAVRKRELTGQAA